MRRGAEFAVALPELRLGAGEVAALFGPSGSGKSTLLAGLLGLVADGEATVGGRVRLCGAELGRTPAAAWRRLLAHQVAFLAQEAGPALDPLRPVGQQLVAAARVDRAAAVAALQSLGVAAAAALLDRLPHQISGGEAQRVLLAVALLRRPALVVADEPTASLDGGSYGELLAALRRLRDDGVALLVASHDRRLLRDLDARVLVAGPLGFLPGAATAPEWPRCDAVVAAGAPVLAAHGLEVAFGRRQVLAGVDVALRPGEFAALCGASGAGKSTLLRVLAGWQTADRGQVMRPHRRSAVQYCGQDARGTLTPGRTLGSLLDEARAPGFELEPALAALRLPRTVLERTGAELSGGERRRAALLRALAVAPAVLLLDEPTAGLDGPAAAALLTELLALQRRQCLALLLATHDPELAAVAPRRWTLQDGTLSA